ncbi:MAG: hypothetical protein AAF438_21760, partial [Pseudomonadota bacterium]
VDVVVKLVIVCGVLQAIAYLVLLAAPIIGIVSYADIYNTLRESDEFIFRHDPSEGAFIGFFYKGAFHLCVAAVFLVIDDARRNYWLALVVMVAIALTLTRGLMVGLALTLVVGAVVAPKRHTMVVLSALGVILMVGFGSLDLLTLASRPTSDSVRLDDLQLIWEQVSLEMLLLGNGIGSTIGSRERIEMTYLEILFKQGLLGLAFWGSLLAYNFMNYWRVRSRYPKRALALLSASVFVYFATATNTFLTGSIGMSIVLLVAVSLGVLHRYDPTPLGVPESSQTDPPRVPAEGGSRATT